MAQTSPWLSVGEAAVRLGVTEHEARALAISGRIRSRLADCNHRELEAAAVEEYAKRGSELAAREGEDLAETAGPPKSPAWTPWSSVDDPEARDQQADFDDDTSTEEGDDEQ